MQAQFRSTFTRMYTSLSKGIQVNSHLQRGLLPPRIPLNAQNQRNVIAKRHQLPVHVPHRDIEVEPPVLDLLRRHAHGQPLDPFLRKRRLRLEVHDHRREPHLSSLLVLGLEVPPLGGIAARLALPRGLQQLAQLRRG